MGDGTPRIAGTGYEVALRYHDGSTRQVRVTDRETPFPPGELIVSQTDPAGNITMCNPAFVHMSGYSVEELLGTPHHILRHPDMPRAAFADLWNTISAGHRWTGYVKNLRKDGGFYWVFATVLPTVRKGQVTGYTSVRRAPARRRVEEAAALYVQLRREEDQAVRASTDAAHRPVGAGLAGTESAGTEPGPGHPSSTGLRDEPAAVRGGGR
jgi:PAS domain S-box-containing protein